MNRELMRLIVGQFFVHTCMTGTRLAAPLLALRDGYSRPQQMSFFVTTLSGENANRKNPQIFSICEIKILFPLFMARAKRRPF